MAIIYTPIGSPTPFVAPPAKTPRPTGDQPPLRTRTGSNTVSPSTGFNTVSTTTPSALPRLRSDDEIRSARDRYLLADNGTPVHWPLGSEISYFINPENDSGLSEADVVRTVQKSVAHWQTLLGGAARFRYAGITHDMVDTYLNPEMNVIYFDAYERSSSAWAFTYPEFTDSGRMTGFDIALNDGMYDFTPSGVKPRTDLDTAGYAFEASMESILTHELGHTLGLRDLYSSAYAASAMYYVSEGETVPLIGIGDQKALSLCYYVGGNEPKPASGNQAVAGRVIYVPVGGNLYFPTTTRS